jgi:hypothetical protein
MAVPADRDQVLRFVGFRCISPSCAAYGEPATDASIRVRGFLAVPPEGVTPQEMIKENQPISLTEQPPLKCEGCGGPHRFDTSVPSVVWNEVIRARGLSDFLCTNCILEAFAKAGKSFTAQLYGEGLNGLPMEFRINSLDALTPSPETGARNLT